MNVFNPQEVMAGIHLSFVLSDSMVVCLYSFLNVACRIRSFKRMGSL